MILLSKINVYYVYLNNQTWCAEQLFRKSSRRDVAGDCRDRIDKLR
jgi:hypothetical protein